jgi:deoxyribodipyrimidine photo-lyase
MKRSLIWFKTDLRLHDNETLVKAIEKSDVVIPIYCIDEALLEKTEFGFGKMGSFRAQFLLESLENLDQNLRKLGSGLIVLKGKPDVEIPKLAHDLACTKVYAKKEVGAEEKALEKKVEEALWKQKSELEVFSTSTLYYATDLPFSIKDIPDVFTVFRKKIEKECSVRPVFERPLHIESPFIPPMNKYTLKDLGLKKVKTDPRRAFEFKGGEDEALKRLSYYLFDSKLISSYKETRNGMLGPDYSSKFSAWLALGCISPREIYVEIKKYEEQVGANESTYWLIFELIWRDYFRFMSKKYQNAFFKLSGFKGKEPEIVKLDKIKLKNWIDGKTGVDFVDANMIELKQTGFMSNRGRQNVASYFCHELKFDWRIGASYFEEQLIDYDVSSNWGNWAYIAGVGNDPKEKRVFNLEKQAKEYDSDGKYRIRWLAKEI